MYTNKLIDEKSPYLLQHAHNPVDWYPWGREAFAKARAENKPIFLSVGYSTCHWCHVMERESFENEEVARALNDKFVSIKVDREERPDVDRIYMTFVQSATGGGGWPMSVWMTPDLKPFYGGTYYPPADAYGRPGFPTVLARLSEAWERDREQVIAASEKVIQQLNEQVAQADKSGVKLDAGDFENGFYNFRRAFDSKHGGFGSAPKFPRPVTHEYLFRWYAKSGNYEAAEMVLKTLRAMAAGGMNDHLGGGFHRYSVDERWFVPHFEKMLYDQAQLAVSYLQAHQISGEEHHAKVARDIFEYVLRDVTHEGGAFFSAEDADSVIDPANPTEKGEGAFYIWTDEEIKKVVGEPVAEWFNYRYGVVAGGNVDNDPQQEFTGRCILYEARDLKHVAEHFDKSEDEIAKAIEQAKSKLLEVRNQRVRPHLDDKILTAWNGLMISGFALGAGVLGDDRYLDAARRAAEFILSEMYDGETGILLRRYRNGDGAIEGFLDDYAFFAQGLIDLYEASFDWRYLDIAEKLAEKMMELFADTEKGAFFTTSDKVGDLVLRLKDDYDGAEPSGNAVAILVLLRLAQSTGRQDFRQAAEAALNALSKTVRSGPATAPLMLVGLDFMLATPKQIVIAGESADQGFAALAAAARARFLPHRVLLHADAAARERWKSTLPALAGMAEVEGKAAAYVCENYTCQLPVTDVARLDELLQ